jgi:hypothetical protein
MDMDAGDRAPQALMIPELLPYHSYDPEGRVFVQGDGSLGWRGCSRPSNATPCPRRLAGSWPGRIESLLRAVSRGSVAQFPGVERPKG